MGRQSRDELPCDWVSTEQGFVDQAGDEAIFYVVRVLSIRAEGEGEAGHSNANPSPGLCSWIAEEGQFLGRGNVSLEA